jgi:hypothetical protein
LTDNDIVVNVKHIRKFLDGLALKYARQLNMVNRIPITFSTKHLSLAWIDPEDGSLDVNIVRFLDLYAVDKELTKKLFAGIIAHEVAHIRQHEKNERRYMSSHQAEANALHVAERLTGMSPRTLHDVLFKLRRKGAIIGDISGLLIHY